MATLGKALQEARTQRGIDLNEVQRVTKIRVKFLRAMEEDRWEEMPAPGYTRGFISIYAEFLGLDGAALVDEYRNTVEGADRAEPIPQDVVRPGVLRQHQARLRGRSIKPLALVLAGIAAAVVVVLVIIGSIGGSGNGGTGAAHRGASETGPAKSAPSGQPPQTSEVAVELRSTAPVWVCLVDDTGRSVVDGETMAADESRGPYSGRSFEVTFGNGSVEMTVNGQPAAIPAVAHPLGYRIIPGGVRKLAPSSQPTCL
jgi:cytoskeleton protein RodZ